MIVACPAPHVDEGVVTLGHGSGGRLSQRLLDEIILPAFSSPELDRRDDQAQLSLGPGRVAFTTDSFVVTPLFFPGGDIGKLAVHGTVNDLAMAGARPRFLSVSFILEEGLPLETLRRVVASIRDAARACGVAIATGDTKVVGRGHADRLFVNTSGLGAVPEGVDLSCDRVRPGDVAIVSGTLADHGMAVLSAREDLGFGDALASDTAPLHELVAALLASGADLRCLRDPTRGGLAASLSEIAARSGVGVEIDEAALPVRPEVRGACELLGLDPLFVANEGKFVAFCAPESEGRALAALRSHPLGRGAARVARATPARGLSVRTSVGGRRALDLPLADPLPRIC
ncbi:MAG TPA: hydrogenase expression/formation protein HypE [Polyangiaceae bacterium]|nr:hydrogenase expression/formation protein HypE [Polyangiaceae bacterium]